MREETIIVKKIIHTSSPAPDRREALRSELIQQVSSLIGDELLLATAVPGLTIHRRTAPSDPVAGTYEPSIAVVLQGTKRVSLDAMDFVHGPSRFLLTSIDLPVTSQVTGASAEEAYLCLRLQLDMNLVRELLSSELDLPAWTGSTDPGITTAETTVELFDAFNRVVRLHGAPQDIGFMGSLIQREIIYRILQTPEGRRLRAIATLGDCSQRTAKVIEWIRENYAQPLRVEDLAEIACMGTSTLHHHFRALTSMSPLQYQKRLRLHEARRRMLMEGMDASTVAFFVGYESVSQFNREYSRLFGQPPMRDVRSLRLAGGTETRQ
jgi:AraC-like DNA-binding protein